MYYHKTIYLRVVPSLEEEYYTLKTDVSKSTRSEFSVDF